LDPSRSKHSIRFPAGKFTFRNASDCLSLPAAGSIGIATASDQRSRLVSLPGGSLSSPTPACTARSFSNQDNRRWLPKLPVTAFGGSGSVPEKAARRPSRPEPASRNSLSLPQDDRLFPDCHSGIEVSGLPLQCLAELSTEPFGSRLLRSPRLAPVWARSTPQARSLHSAQQPQPLLGSPLPFGAFWTLPDQSVRSDSRSGGSPSEMCPVAFRSPPPVLLE